MITSISDNKIATGSSLYFRIFALGAIPWIYFTCPSCGGKLIGECIAENMFTFVGASLAFFSIMVSAFWLQRATVLNGKLITSNTLGVFKLPFLHGEVLDVTKIENLRVEERLRVRHGRTTFVVICDYEKDTLLLFEKLTLAEAEGVFNFIASHIPENKPIAGCQFGAGQM